VRSSVSAAAAVAADAHDLAAQGGIVFVIAAPESRVSHGLAVAYAAHLRAQMHAVEVNRNPVRLKNAIKRVRYFNTNPFLHRETARKQTHQPRQFRDADDVLMC